VGGRAYASIPLIAKVLCHSGSRGEQHPVAVIIGGTRTPIEEIVEEAVIGSIDATVPSRRVMKVRLLNGQVLELRRLLPDGEWRTWQATEAE